MNPEVPKFSPMKKEEEKIREKAERRGEDPDEAVEKYRKKIEEASAKSRVNYQEDKKSEMKKSAEKGS